MGNFRFRAEENREDEGGRENRGCCCWLACQTFPLHLYASGCAKIYCLQINKVNHCRKKQKSVNHIPPSSTLLLLLLLLFDPQFLRVCLCRNGAEKVSSNDRLFIRNSSIDVIRRRGRKHKKCSPN